jgi:hypothetical protein
LLLFLLLFRLLLLILLLLRGSRLLPGVLAPAIVISAGSVAQQTTSLDVFDMVED